MPKLLRKEANPERMTLLEKLLHKSKKMMETYFLKDSKFICGNEISFKLCANFLSSGLSVLIRVKAGLSWLSG